MSSVVVTTGSRLHFGLLGFGHPGQRQWGGLGLMMDRPVTKVRVSLSDRLAASGPEAERALAAAHHWSRSGGTCREVGARIEVLEAPPTHVGLGSGTQLALAIGRALDELHGRRTPIESLAKRVGRTRRSSVGAFGFAQGGLIYEHGKLPGDDLGQLGTAIAVPDHWRFVLAYPIGMTGISGEAEMRAFREIPPADPSTTARLIELAEKCILPAARAGDIEAFGQRLTEFNRLAGSWYSAIQGGPYLNEVVARMVEGMLALGASGAGQSSWGPTAFAVVANAGAANLLRDKLASIGGGPYDAWIAAPRNQGAAVVSRS